VRFIADFQRALDECRGRGEEVPARQHLWIMGDGSGLKWDDPGGWAVVLFEVLSNRLKVLVGASNALSVNTAEMVPYWMALRYHWNQMRERKKITEPVQVVILSDSEVTVNAGRSRMHSKINGDMQAAFHYYAEKGYRLHWYHVPRDCVSLHTLVDVLSKQSRAAMKEMGVDESLVYKL